MKVCVNDSLFGLNLLVVVDQKRVIGIRGLSLRGSDQSGGGGKMRVVV